MRVWLVLLRLLTPILNRVFLPPPGLVLRARSKRGSWSKLTTHDDDLPQLTRGMITLCINSNTICRAPCQSTGMEELVSVTLKRLYYRYPLLSTLR